MKSLFESIFSKSEDIMATAKEILWPGWDEYITRFRNAATGLSLLKNLSFYWRPENKDTILNDIMKDTKIHRYYIKYDTKWNYFIMEITNRLDIPCKIIFIYTSGVTKKNFNNKAAILADCFRRQPELMDEVIKNHGGRIKYSEFKKLYIK